MGSCNIGDYNFSVDSQPMMEETILVGDDLMMGPPSPVIPPEIASHVLEGVELCDGILRNLFLCLQINDIEPFCQDELALYRQCAENRDKVLRVRLQESEYKLGSSMPIDLAKERVTQLESEATSLERHLILASGAEGIEGFRQRWSLHGRMTDTKKRLESLKRGMENRKKEGHDQPAKPSTPKRWFLCASSLCLSFYCLRIGEETMSSKDKKPAKPSSSRTGGIRTLSDLNRRSNPDSDSDSDGPQEYYTGGEKSGMMVQDPSKKDDVDEIFNQARQLGAVEGPLETPSSSSRSFTGTGRLLSGESVSTPPPQQPDPVAHNIIFWSNGFTIDDGPLRKLDDPENASFLESIRKSECPKELEPEDRRAPVHVNLMRREENCPEREKPKVSFQGVGRTLSGGTPSLAPDSAAVPVQTGLAAPPSPTLVIDETLPTASIQIRLADGTRLVAKFNHHHTVSDIRAFIDSSRPGAPVNYQLQTMGFPPAPLTDLTQTIEQAGLANSVVLQKF
ncbi:unnamed protein product [Brassica oleracea var. botrytis]|nr:unnamed protein product [Brassica napus]